MAKRIEGVDVSHWNSTSAFIDARPEFAIIKLTEGKTHIDTDAGTHKMTAEALGIPYGFYHYARAEKNSARAEAEFFVNSLVKHGVQFGSCVLALDYEGKALSINGCDAWAREWLDAVFELTGVRPLLYCSQSTVKRFKKVCAGNYGLWVARYRNKLLGAGDITPWKFAAIWQYDSKGIDKNIFYGTVEQFKKYGKVVDKDV